MVHSRLDTLVPEQHSNHFGYRAYHPASFEESRPDQSAKHVGSGQYCSGSRMLYLLAHHHASPPGVCEGHDRESAIRVGRERRAGSSRQHAGLPSVLGWQSRAERGEDCLLPRSVIIRSGHLSETLDVESNIY